MLRFATLVTELDQTNSTLAKVEALCRFLSEASDPDKLWMMALFSHRRPRRGVSSTLLRTWAADRANLPDWLIEEAYHIVGDLAETLAFILPPASNPPQEQGLAPWMEQVKALASLDEPDKQASVLRAWDQLDKTTCFVYHKLITGGFRLGVSQQLLVQALARHTGLEPNAVAHRLMGDWSPDTTDFHSLLFADDQADNLSRPYPFFLAYPLDNEPDALGNPAEWQAEWKWDGIRSQYIRRGGQGFLWSRGEELITDRFPELQPLQKALPDGTVIDGELLPFRDGQPLPFSLLQTRIGRKTLSKKQLKEAPCLILAYDLLEWRGEDIRQKPLSERRELLAALVAATGLPDCLRLSETVRADSWQDLARARLAARDQQAEGLMLKRLDSAYETGRRRGDWWKWKVDPLSIDAVMIYAQRGHGRRANLYTDYTFAVWHEGQLVPFAKAYSGLTDAEIVQVDAWVKQHTLDRFGPVRAVEPQLVFEIGFEGINRSPRHKSGVALRFPRILRWRQDKPAAEADQLSALLKLVE